MGPFLSFVIFLFSLVSKGDSLSLNYYEKTCPDVEFIVAKAVKEAFSKDKTVPAAILRMHFHDCFIRVSVQKKYHSYLFSCTVLFELISVFGS